MVSGTVAGGEWVKDGCLLDGRVGGREEYL